MDTLIAESSFQKKKRETNERIIELFQSITGPIGAVIEGIEKILKSEGRKAGKSKIRKVVDGYRKGVK